MHAYEVHAYEVYPHDMHARKMHAHGDFRFWAVSDTVLICGHKLGPVIALTARRVRLASELGPSASPKLWSA
jgi:hypothetical protein